MKDRAAFVLPVVVVCGLLLASMVMAFQFVSSSDYKQQGRLMRTTQAAAIADLAADEIAARINQAQTGTGGNAPAWIKGLLTALDGAKGSASSGRIGLTQDLSNVLADLKVTKAQADKSGMVTLKDAKATVGPFRVLAGGGFKELIYKDVLFPDDAKDPEPWDLRGSLNVEVSIDANGAGPFAFSQKYLRGQELEITDTTPPGRYHALMSYLPPHSPDFAVNDLQRGGALTINAEDGRVMVRGPLVYMSEDAKPLPAPMDKRHLGDDAPNGTGPGTLAGYPDNVYVTGLATVPGPREMQHPDNAAGATPGGLPGVDNALVGTTKKEMNPRRAGAEGSKSTLETKARTFHLNIKDVCFGIDVDKDVPFPSFKYEMTGLSAMMAKGLETDATTFDSIDVDPAAYYPPLAYYYGLLPAGQHKFTLALTPPGSTVANSFKGGVTVPAGGGTPTKGKGGATNEGDVVVMEPIPRSGQTDADNVGVVGLYGLAVVESKTYLAIPVSELGKYLFDQWLANWDEKDDKVKPPFCNKKKGDVAQDNRDSLVGQIMSQLGLDDSIKFMLRRYKVEAKMSFDAPATIDPGTLQSRLSAKEGIIAPFGSYWHDASFWTTGPATAAVKAAMKDGLKTPDNGGQTTQQILSALLVKNGQPNIGAVDGSWAAGADAPDGTKAKVVRDFLAVDMAKQFLRYTAAKGAGDPGQALQALLADADGVKGIPEVRSEGKPRPQGAFGPYGGTMPPALTEAQKTDLKAKYPRGTFPLKMRDWEESATRRYDTVDEWLAAETRGGSVELRGAVFVKTAKTAANFVYKGRGILVVTTTDASAPAELSGTITAADANSRLTLVHRVAPALVTPTKVPPLVLGTRFEGTVLSESGVKPKSGTLQISGSLITGLLNKTGIDDSATVQLKYAADTVGGMPDAWTVEAGGEVTSADPGP